MRLAFIAAPLAAVALAACNQQTAETPEPAPEEQATPIEAPSGEYTLDKTHASLTLRANHFGLSNYTLRFTNLDGTLTFNAEDPTQSTLVASARTDSVETDYVGDRDFDAELQNSEWFDAANHPEITFRSTSIERTGPNTGRMTGDLTIRGQTHPAMFDIVYNRSYARHPLGPAISMIGFSAQGIVQRSQYGMNVLLPQGGGPGVADQVNVVIEAEFTRPVDTASDAAPPANP
ncbi:MAG: YceI family protein [Hyphomonadaceae bacterium]